MKIKEFYDQQTGTLSYIAFDASSLDCVIIDPVLNYNKGKNTTSTESIDLIKGFIKSNHLKPKYILETHVHADHLSSSQLLKTEFPMVKLAINKNISQVQSIFKPELKLKNDFNTDGRQFDCLLSDGQILEAGTIEIKVLFTPGHTPACTSFIINNNAFTGDAIFMPDLGTGRCDFPGGSAKELYQSIKNKIYQLPDNYVMYTGHDYPPENRPLKFKTTIKDQKENNKHLTYDTSLEEFIEFRTHRDKSLNPPRLINASLKVNLNGGSTEYLSEKL